VPIESTLPTSIFDEMDRWFDGGFRHPFSWFGRPWWRSGLVGMEELTPSIDVFEEDDELVVKVELPGMEKDNIRVDLNDDVLTVSGEKEKKEKIAEKHFHREERFHGSFRRSIRLPVEVQTDKVKATFKSGVLEVRLPKTEETKKKVTKISIQ
jgi:HSP20 family protein